MKRLAVTASLPLLCLSLGSVASAQDKPAPPGGAPDAPLPSDTPPGTDASGPDAQSGPPTPAGGAASESGDSEASAEGGAAENPSNPSDAVAETEGTSAEPGLPDEEMEMPLIPSAPDELTGHFRLALGGGFATPFGSFHADLKETDRIASGGAVTAAATYGVSPTVALGLGGEMAFFGSSSDCPACSAASIGFGPRVAYHLVQGTRFDPWGAIGVGYRTTTLKTGAADQSYSGIEWLHLEVGGDWYPWPNLGLGPFMSLSAGVYGSRPPNTDRDSYWNFLVGFRAVLQAPGKTAR